MTLKNGIIITLFLATISFIILITFSIPIIEVFNTSHQLLAYASVGLHLLYKCILQRVKSIVHPFLNSNWIHAGIILLSILRVILFSSPRLFWQKLPDGVLGS